jgi:RNA polymerase sigma-70 factor, ECF subfamily
LSTARLRSFEHRGPSLVVDPVKRGETAPHRDDAYGLGYTARAVSEAAGDTGSFEELAMPLFARLFNFACWLTQDRATAEELVQETYMKALRGFSSFEQGTNFRAWMYRILRNTFLTSRSGLKTAPIGIDEDASVEPIVEETPETLLLAQYRQAAIWKALDNLPVIFREVILLCDVEEMRYQEIAETLSVPVGTVMSRLSRGRKAMRGLLAGGLR